jgi:hypothetical protein
MQPFDVPESLENINHVYPTAQEISNAARFGGFKARLALARLWLSEGIPYAFHKRPAVYEEVRFWMAARIGVDPKEISIIGSARIGQSLSPDNMEKPFGDSSDLDFLAVSSSLFKALVEDFNRWSYDYESNAISPRNDRERRFWDDHLKRGPNVIDKGFMDASMVPLLNSYSTSVKIGQTMYLLVEKLKITPSSPHVRHASLRVFSSWEVFVRQAERSLTSLQQKSVKRTATPNSATDRSGKEEK